MKFILLALAPTLLLAACGDRSTGGQADPSLPQLAAPATPADVDPLPVIGPVEPIGAVGSPGPGCLSVEPGVLEFEAEAAGCVTDEATVTVTNRCGAPVHLDRIALDAGAPFLLLAEPPLPAAIASGESVSVVVGYRPTNPGDQTDALRLGFDDRERTLAVRGTAGEPTWLTDHYETEPLRQVDVLFVIDNGNAMAEHQATLLANLRPFLAYARAQDIDLHLAVTTTGLEPGGDCPGGVGGGEDGRLFPVVGETPRVFTSEAGDEEAWIANLSVGACREGPNHVFEAALRALTPPASDTIDDPRHPEPDDGNAGFLRAEAHLSVIAISDRDDESPQEPNHYYNALQALKGFRNTHLFNFHAVTGDREDGCTSERHGSAAAGDRLISLVEKTDGGIFQSICAGAWSSLFEPSGAASSGFNSCFILSEPPADRNGDGTISDTDGELEVRVNDELTPSRGAQGQHVWAYDAAQNALCFAPLAVPGPSSSIDIRYRQACL